MKMKRIFRRNQIIITTLAIMIAAAGYLNYSGKKEVAGGDVYEAGVTEISDEDGWAYMGDVGNMLNKRYPEFDTRNYGYTKLTPLVSSLKAFDIMSRRTSNPHITHKFIRNKK